MLTSRLRYTTFLLCALLALLACSLAATAASADEPAPHWHIFTRSAPSTLAHGQPGETISLLANLGDAPLEGSATEPVVISDALPGGVKAIGQMILRMTEGNNEKAEAPEVKCEPTHCLYIGKLPPFISLEARVHVETEEGTSGQIGENVITVSGGVKGHAAGEAEGRAMLSRGGNGTVPFGVERYEVTPEQESGEVDREAGSHPFQLTTTIAFNQELVLPPNHASPEPHPMTSQLVRDVHAVLPPGLVGNTNLSVVGQCSGFDFGSIERSNANECGEESAIGVALVTFNDPPPGPGYKTATVPVYNLEPSAGEPARFGFEFEDVQATLDTAIQTGKGYAVEVNSINVSSAASVLSTIVTIWGNPQASQHNDARGWQCLGGGYKVEKLREESGTHQCVENKLEESKTPPYLTLPTVCSSPMESSVGVDSWNRSNEAAPPVARTTPLQLTGCENLPFSASFSASPDQSAAATPSGFKFAIEVPQETTVAPGSRLAEADIGQNTVALPEGVEANAGSANGLGSCPAAESGGFGIGLEPGQPESAQLENDHFTSAATSCPDASKLGTVTIHSPLLEDPLEGEVFLASQNTNPFRTPLVLYLIAEDKKAGVLVKLAGEVQIGSNGQLVTTFRNTPPVPFESLELNLDDGPRAAQVTPSFCRLYTTSAEFVPSSGEAAVHGSSSFTPTPNPDGVPCPESGPLVFAPGFQAGSTNSQAGAFSKFTLTVGKPDGEGALQSIDMTLPPGLAAVLGSVPLCPEPQASEGTCSQASRIGSSVVQAGLGGSPFELPGEVFLTGPYNGAPFGLSAVTNATEVGPFNIGRIVARSSISVNEVTAAATIDTEHTTVFPSDGGPPEQFNGLPERIKGLPSQIKALHVTVDRPEFQFNPTNCTPMETTGALGDSEGVSDPIHAPFEVTNCAALPFAPKIKAEVKGQGSKVDGVAFKVTLESPGLGQLNIHKVDLTLPKALPSRLDTIQKACTEQVFNVNPASCDEGSVIGEGIVHTPVFKNPLRGPAYLVGHAGAEFPDVEFVLQGEGVTVLLDGKTFIEHGVTFSKFETSPDAPFTKFESIFPESPHSALGVESLLTGPARNLCKLGTSLAMPTVFGAQNGAQVAGTTKIAITGCAGKLGEKSTKLTRAQQLKKALAACKKKDKKNKAKRLTCEKQAHKKFGAKKAAKKHGAKKSAKQK